MKKISIVLSAAIVVAGLSLALLLSASADKRSDRIHHDLAAVRAQAEYAASVAEISDRVIDLPEDAGAWHTSILTTERPNARELQILGWFDRDPQLARLKQQTHFHHYTPRSAVYTSFAVAAANGLPVVMVQTSTGEVIYKASGQDVPATPWPLVRGIIDCIRAHCPHCPRPKPKPEPSPEPVPDTPPNVIPDIVGPDEDTDPSGRDDTLVVTVAAFLLAVGIGFVATAKNSSGPRLK